MKLKVNKNELAGALIALGKLVCRTATDAEFKALRIEAGENQVRFSTCSLSEQITFKTECRSEGAFHCLVGFDEFRDAVRGCRNKVLEIEDGEGTLRVGDRTLFPMSSVEWRVPSENEHSIVSELPKGVVSLLSEAAQLVNRNEPRKILHQVSARPRKGRPCHASADRGKVPGEFRRGAVAQSVQSGDQRVQRKGGVK